MYLFTAVVAGLLIASICLWGYATFLFFKDIASLKRSAKRKKNISIYSGA